MGEGNISPVDHLVLVSSCVLVSCYNRRKGYPRLEKPSTENITAFENQGKQCKLNDH